MGTPRAVTFHSHGARIAGLLRLPEEAKAPVVVMCAGMTLTKEVWLPANADWLAAHGYATLSFDYRGSLARATLRSDFASTTQNSLASSFAFAITVTM